MLLAWFLPFHFLTCTNFQFAYSREEAEELISREETMTGDTASNGAVSPNADSVSYTHPTPPPSRQVTEPPTEEAPYLIKLVLFPAEEATSGLGTLIYYPTPFGKIIAGMGLLATLVLLLGVRWLKRKRALTIGLFSTSILSLLLFTGLSYSDQVELLWGVWVVLALTVGGLVLELISSFAKNGQRNGAPDGNHK